MKRTLPLAILLVLSACGPEELDVPSQNSEPLLRARTCESHEHPGTVLFEATTDGHPTAQCTGTLIAPDVVLTAAHCIHGPSGQVVFLDVGKLIRARQVVPHSDFRKSPGFDQHGLGTMNDIALVFLDEVAPVQPAILISGDEGKLLRSGLPVSMEGLGSTTAPNQGAGIQKCGSAVLARVGETELRIEPDSTLTNVCFGDSGGPTFITVEGASIYSQRVVGVNTRMKSADCTGWWIVTRVDAYLDWMQQVLSNGCFNGQRAWCQTKGLPSQCLTLTSEASEPKFVDSCGQPKSRCGDEATGLPAVLALLVRARRRTGGMRNRTAL